MFLLSDTRDPSHVLIQISDTHIVPEGALLHDKVDTHAALRGVLDQVELSGLAVSALLFTGDLADSGDLASYQRLRALVEPYAERLGVPVLYVMGNHDSRGPFRAGLLGTEPDGALAAQPHDYVHWVDDDLRIVVLDTTEPGEHAGLLSVAQLSWLADQLATAAPAGTVLALHHPPIPSPIPMLNKLLLAQEDELAKILDGSDVRIVLAGHAHHASAGILGGVPVWVAGATAYSARTVGPADRFGGMAGGQYTRIDIRPSGAVATSVPVTPGETVYDLDLSAFDELAAQPQ